LSGATAEKIKDAMIQQLIEKIRVEARQPTMSRATGATPHGPRPDAGYYCSIGTAGRTCLSQRKGAVSARGHDISSSVLMRVRSARILLALRE
jgi:hypothetical protein